MRITTQHGGFVGLSESLLAAETGTGKMWEVFGKGGNSAIPEHISVTMKFL